MHGNTFGVPNFMMVPPNDTNLTGVVQGGESKHLMEQTLNKIPEVKGVVWHLLSIHPCAVGMIMDGRTYACCRCSWHFASDCVQDNVLVPGFGGGGPSAGRITGLDLSTPPNQSESEYYP